MCCNGFCMLIWRGGRGRSISCCWWLIKQWKASTWAGEFTCLKTVRSTSIMYSCVKLWGICTSVNWGESGEVRTINVKQFQALRYENDGGICLFQGPITKPRNTGDERISCQEYSHIALYRLCSDLSCIDTCITPEWEIRRREYAKPVGTKFSLVVHLEKKKGVKSALVNAENLQITFYQVKRRKSINCFDPQIWWHFSWV